jgi:hypothetical protein
MKRAFVLSALILVLLPAAFAQRGGRQLSADDQSRFDSYFQRWQNYQRTNNQGDSRSMEKRMQSIYQRYGIRADSPYRDVASNANRGGNLDRDWAREQDRDRAWHLFSIISSIVDTRRYHSLGSEDEFSSG